MLRLLMAARAVCVAMAVAACGSNAAPGAPAGSGSGSASAAPAPSITVDASAPDAGRDGAVQGGGSPAAHDAGAAPADAGRAAAGARGTPAAASATPCVPSLGAFGYIGRELVSCHPDGGGGHACWTIDKATGKVQARRGEPLPGVGFYVDRDRLGKPRCFQDLCWPTSGEDTSVPLFVAYHPDGARAAIDDGGRVFVFDRASKTIVSSFVARLSNSLMGLWFVGDLILVAGTDAGPYAEVEVYSARGKHLTEYDEFFQGGLGITSDGRALIAEAASDTITVLNGKTGKGKKRKRRVPPRPPADCDPIDPSLDPSDRDPKRQACLAFRARHYGPYISAVFVDSGRDFIGGTHDWLVVIDGRTLAEKSRVRLAVCPRPPDSPELR